MIRLYKLPGKGYYRIESHFVKLVHRKEIERFLKRFVNEFIEQMKSYIEASGEDPFYNERCTSSVITPAISRITPFFICEQQVKRIFNDKKKRKSIGHVDYWCGVGKKYGIFIEVKFNDLKYDGDEKEYDALESKWVTANQQIDSIMKDAGKEWDKRQCIFISLMVSPIYEKSLKSDYATDHEKLMRLFNRYYRNLRSNKPNWGLLWVLHPSLCEKSKEEIINNNGERDKNLNNNYLKGIMLIGNVRE